jgi:hypothetical protein
MEKYAPFAGAYDIDDIQGDRIFLRASMNLPGSDTLRQKPFVVDLDRRANRFSIAERGSDQPPILCKRLP